MIILLPIAAILFALGCVWLSKNGYNVDDLRKLPLKGLPGDKELTDRKQTVYDHLWVINLEPNVEDVFLMTANFAPGFTLENQLIYECGHCGKFTTNYKQLV